ncbi:MAG: transcription-repair coupling factor, partial [Chloroflexi bacterium]|nr:transcription-repair coupling factor [Chloroflexota bacterium]
MNLSSLLTAFRALPEYADVTQRIGRESISLNLPRAARLPFAASLIADLNRPALLTWGPRTIHQRLATLSALTSNLQSPISISSARALFTRTLPKRDFLAASRPLKIGTSIRLEKLLEAWSGAGYTSESIVVEPGQFSRRGGIIDIWTHVEATPVRIELFGDEIESLKRFDPNTQRSGEAIETITIYPAREALPKNGTLITVDADSESDLAADVERLNSGSAFATLEFFLPLLHPTQASLFDYLPENTLVFVDDWDGLHDTINGLETQALELRANAFDSGLIKRDFPTPNLSWSDIQDELSHLPLIQLGRATDEIDTVSIPLGEHFKPGPRFGGQIKTLFDHVKSVNNEQSSVIIVSRQVDRLAELWNEEAEPITPAEEPNTASPLSFVNGALGEGFILQSPITNYQLLTDSEIFGWSRPEPRRRRTTTAQAHAPESSYADFQIGDHLVHLDYGIGKFMGLVKRSIDNSEREYIHIQYEGGDDLYVPIIQADRLTKYVGSDEDEPALSRLGTQEWVTARQRAREAAEEIAGELLELYAKRELTQGRTFNPDTVWQKELEAAFGYIETDDQTKAIKEVKQDMERPRPMDRLICGDVGYGKTEVALRAAFKAVNDGTQVAVLVPTTVLAQQHHHTFTQRLAAYPVKVEMLSRFRSPSEQDQIIEKMATGEVDIVIGTHRLISKDVQFKNLGLLVIDEEQRFGVTHKERLKQMRTEVDVLTLTATPIPRTLYMSLAGIRDISMIQTPPDERLPVLTHVGNEKTVRQAILREIDRDGQIFFVHNRVQSIGVVKNKLEKLVPEARIGIAHGQMDEHQLSQVMDAFDAGEIDILLSTSIIESGLDIPNANTLIVDRADMFGLAQLYQLRGRVGRAANRAYAYFFHDRTHRMTPEGRQRLETIAEQTDLGAGYSIAMRDLEMRGAGDILGARQSGQVAAVGFHLYTRLLAQAVKRLKAGVGVKDEVIDLDLSLTTVDLPLPSTLPSEYISDRNLRLRLYRRMAEIKDEKQI